MESNVAISETNDSVFTFYGNLLPPDLLHSSEIDGCCFLCASIDI